MRGGAPPSPPCSHSQRPSSGPRRRLPTPKVPDAGCHLPPEPSCQGTPPFGLWLLFSLPGPLHWDPHAPRMGPTSPRPSTPGCLPRVLGRGPPDFSGWDTVLGGSELLVQGVGTHPGSLGGRGCGSGEGGAAGGGSRTVGGSLRVTSGRGGTRAGAGGRPRTDRACLGTSRTTQRSQGTRGSRCPGWAADGGGGGVGLPAPPGPCSQQLQGGPYLVPASFLPVAGFHCEEP